jgi:excisionase family DNA binding protein
MSQKPFQLADRAPYSDSEETRCEIVAEGLLTVREAADFLSVSRTTLYQMMDDGLLCFVKRGRSRRIPRRAVVELAARQLKGGDEMGR